MGTENIRETVLQSLGADSTITAELLAYNQNHFKTDTRSAPDNIPLPDEPCVRVWEEYLQEMRSNEPLAILRKYMPQLCFPIKEGTRGSDDYRRATLKGESPDSLATATGLELTKPEELRVELYHSPAGHIPVITTGDRQDFVSLLQAVTKKNEPEAIPDSQGAAMIAGYPNWDRIKRYQKEWKHNNPGGAWNPAFKELTSKKKEMYQDRLIILSDGPYSGVAASSLELSDSEWREKSWKIRLAHECAHYFTRRALDSMQNKLIDEIIADCAGIVASEGQYRADWFLRFMGLENFPEYRPGGRLENYKGDPELSDAAFEILQRLVVDAANNIEKSLNLVDRDWSTPAGQALLITTLSYLTVEEMASLESEELLKEALEKAEKWVGGIAPLPRAHTQAQQ